MIVPVMAISNLVLTRQIYSEETNGAHAHNRDPVPLKDLFGRLFKKKRETAWWIADSFLLRVAIGLKFLFYKLICRTL